MNNNKYLFNKKRMLLCLALSTCLSLTGCKKAVSNFTKIEYENSKTYKKHSSENSHFINNYYIVIVENDRIVIYGVNKILRDNEYIINNDASIILSYGDRYYCFDDYDVAFEFANSISTDYTKIVYIDYNSTVSQDNIFEKDNVKYILKKNN